MIKVYLLIFLVLMTFGAACAVTPSSKVASETEGFQIHLWVAEQKDSTNPPALYWEPTSKEVEKQIGAGSPGEWVNMINGVFFKVIKSNKLDCKPDEGKITGEVGVMPAKYGPNIVSSGAGCYEVRLTNSKGDINSNWVVFQIK